MKITEFKYTNSLIKESSPYLLQHAHNPVNWFAWNDETLAKAKQENKPILISIGYSACHWCHVMEHESFEDEQVAQLMNDHFICIKVDREERPDIDQVYMTAVQLMTGQGGWPLNCFALPDGRPVFGGTYFPKQKWMDVLLNITDLYTEQPQRFSDYAEQLTEGIKLAELVKVNDASIEFNIDTLHQTYANWKIRFDTIEGGPNISPKFPLPNNYQFLLQYAFSKSLSNEMQIEVLKQVELTLKKMAYGGIYDQIGGGFARYSTDHYWKAPHFEKMLYDNAQLVTLYSLAFQATKNPLYKQIVFETLAFIEREMTSVDGAFYSALDADSEGEEGKFYVWTKEELQSVLKERFNLFADYFNINERGLWEHGNYILLRHESDEVVAANHNISVPELQKIISGIKNELLEIRGKRIRPGLDNKVLTSWNALMLKGYIDAYNAFDEQHFLEVAIKNMNYLFANAINEQNKISHLVLSAPAKGKENIGFLEDYCFFIDALIALYEATFNETYLLKANDLMNYCIQHFMDKNSGMFYFTSDQSIALIARKMELTDNVIPASNSSIAKSLFKLGLHLENENYSSLCKRMLNNVLNEIPNYGAGYSNWGMLLLNLTQPFYEIAIVGKSVDEKRKAFNKHHLPNVIFAGSTNESSLPLLKNRTVEGQTFIYVCTNKACLQPVTETEQAIQQMN